MTDAEIHHLMTQTGCGGTLTPALRRFAQACAEFGVAAERARRHLDVHSCHQGCAVAGCVNERLRAELAEAKRVLRVDAMMQLLPEQWRYRWCESRMCGCMGGVNCSGGIQLRARGLGTISKAEWEAWVERNPTAQKPQAPAGR